MARKVYTFLVHYPVISKDGKVTVSAITPLDIHDIARSSRTFGVKKLFVITPVHEQQQLVSEILTLWFEGERAGYNPFREDALSLVEVASSLEEATLEVEEREGEVPVVVGTSAKEREPSVSYRELRKIIDSGRPVILVFGTAWGLAPSVFRRCDFCLKPVWGPTDFNHLSVRAACAIILDRLLGRRD